MKTKNRKVITDDLKFLKSMLWVCVFSYSLLIYLSGLPCWAVSSKITKHTTGADFSGGKVEDVVIGSQGAIQLGLAAETLVDKLQDAWSINSIVVSGGTVFIGTSPNGDIYKYSLGKLTKIPIPKEQESTDSKSDSEPNDANEPPGKTVRAEKYLANKHIFAMATDVAGRLLAGVSGEKCSLIRLEADKLETIFEPNDAKYIFAIVIDTAGSIYLGTGPQGKVYKLNSFGSEPQIVYDSTDKNILSLAIGRDGFIYAGSDTRGLIYKINPRTSTAAVLYDSDQEEITALLFAQDGELYATATSAQLAQAPRELPPQLPLAGRPEVPTEKVETAAKKTGDLKLKIANTKKRPEEQLPQAPALPPKETKPEQVSHVYRIRQAGYVTDVFSETAVFFCLAEQQKKMLLGTGNSARLFSIDPALEQQAVVYQDKHASQITAVVVGGEDVYVGTANPARLIKLGKAFSSKGSYSSALVDAGQPANWGKLQIEAVIPQGSTITASCRSGNVKDVNDPTFSPWTEPAEITEPIQLTCPIGRFCQYKLVLQSKDPLKSPLVREVAVASTVPNLAPKIESVSISRAEAAEKTGVFKITCKAKDENDDKLIYAIDFRRVTKTNWIKLKDEIETDSFEWDGRTVESGRYEIRVTASDERSNTPATKLTGSRISDPVVVDNTPPTIKSYSIKQDKKTVTLKMQVFDELSVIGQVSYTIDSNEKWIGAIPDDLVCDTTQEDFTIAAKDLEPGEHVLSVKITDDVNNTTYKTFDVTVGTE